MKNTSKLFSLQFLDSINSLLCHDVSMYLLVVMYGRHICKRGLLISIFNCMKPHRQNHTKSGGGEKRTCFSCRRFLLSVPVCIAPCHLDIFSAHFCAHGLPFIISFPCWIFERILHNLQSCYGGCSCKKTVKKIRNLGRRFYDF